MKKISPWPFYAEDEIEAATSVLQSGKVNYWTSTTVDFFEKSFADYLGAKHAIAVANGTLALELALRGLKLESDDEVIVPCRTFIASASAVVTSGAKPVIVDVDYKTQNISVNEIIPALTDKTKAIIVVHLSGLPCDMDPIMKLAREKGLKVIEDCAQAHGAKYKGRACGTIGDIAAFSFCQDKIMSTGGEGGMLVTNNIELWKSAWSYKDHGKSYDKAHDGLLSTEYKWLHDTIGTNYRMTAMQAAIGTCQLNKLNDWVRTRRANADILSNHLKEIDGIKVLEFSSDYYHSYYKYYFNIDNDKYSKTEILKMAKEKQVPIMSGICHDISNELAMSGANVKVMEHPNAVKLKDTTIMAMVHPTINTNEMELIAKDIVSLFV